MKHFTQKVITMITKKMYMMRGKDTGEDGKKEPSLRTPPLNVI